MGIRCVSVPLRHVCQEVGFIRRGCTVVNTTWRHMNGEAGQRGLIYGTLMRRTRALNKEFGCGSRNKAAVAVHAVTAEGNGGMRGDALLMVMGDYRASGLVQHK